MTLKQIQICGLGFVALLFCGFVFAVILLLRQIVRGYWGV